MPFILIAFLVAAFVVCGGITWSVLSKRKSEPDSKGISHFSPHPTGDMDEGDYHNGPEGYPPMTSYPESHYGARDEDEEH